MAKAEIRLGECGSGAPINVTTKNKGTVATSGTTYIDTVIDLDKTYLMVSSLLQNDSSYRMGAKTIIKGVINSVADSGTFYGTLTLTGSTLRMAHPGTSSLTNPIRFGLYQLD